MKEKVNVIMRTMPCKYCHKLWDVYYIHESNDEYYVECKKCGVQSSHEKTYNKAIKAWNKQHGE